MNPSRRFAALLCLVALAAAPLALNCGGVPNIPGADIIPGAPKCPDMASVDSMLSFDFAQEFAIKAESAAKLRAGAAVSMEVTAFAASVDNDMKTACGSIASDLGQPGDFKDGVAACTAAEKAMNEVKAKLGAGLKIGLTIKPPVCRANLDVAATCAGSCDARITPGSAKVECEGGKVSGDCSAQCTGSCDVNAAAKCDGECKGSCDAEIKGSCGGTCNGKCDGKASKAACAGVCEGKCEAGTMSGSCKGKCGGQCELKAGAKCEGTCTGKCSAEFKAPRCTGEVKPPEMSAECKAACSARVQAKAECSPALAGVSLSGAADPKLAAMLEATLEKNLPLLLKVSIGLKDNALRIAVDGRAAVEGVSVSIKDLAQDAGAKAAISAGQISACLGGVFQGAIGAAGSLKANVEVSVKFQASVSASGSAGGSAGASGGGAAGAKTAP